jgi:DNA-binding MarR family transcriptional regulator
MPAPRTTSSKAARLSKREFEKLAQFRYQLRRFLRFSEEVTHQRGVTTLQYLLMLQIKGFPGREWATVGELAERLQAQPHGVVSLITRCETSGLVFRQASESDRRRVEVRLTAAGEACLDELAQLHRAELVALRNEFAVPDLRSQAEAQPVKRIRKD